MLFNNSLPGGNVSSVLDFEGLNKLRRGVQTDPNSKRNLEEVSRQFEAMFIQLMLKQARNTSNINPSLFDSSSTRMAQSLSDEQLAMNMTDPGIGLAQALMDQLSGNTNKTIKLGSAKTAKFDALPTTPELGKKAAANSIEELLMMLKKASPKKIAGAIAQAPKHIANFVNKVANDVEQAALASGVPSELILSQAALESGWGKREITYPDGSTTHNLFGIKAGSSWTGKTVDITTTEFKDGKAQKIIQKFRAYDSYEESFKDYANLISNNPRYEKVAQSEDAKQAAQEIQKAGYATDPKYAEKLISIMGYFETRKA